MHYYPQTTLNYFSIGRHPLSSSSLQVSVTTLWLLTADVIPSVLLPDETPNVVAPAAALLMPFVSVVLAKDVSAKDVSAASFP